MPSPPACARSRRGCAVLAASAQPTAMPPAPAAARRLVPAGAAVLFAAWSAAALPFYPAGWPLALAALAGVLALLNHRLGLAFTLAVPVLPLGNYSLGLALVYGAAALAWLIFSWRDAEAGLFMTSGPLLASIGLVAALPVAGLVIAEPRAARHTGGHGGRSSPLQSQAPARSTVSASPPRTGPERPRQPSCGLWNE